MQAINKADESQKLDAVIAVMETIHWEAVGEISYNDAELFKQRLRQASDQLEGER